MGNRSLVYSDFLYDGRQLENAKTDRAQFFKKMLFYPKWPKKSVFKVFPEIVVTFLWI